MTTLPLPVDTDDSLLVERSLAGDRQAFGHIIGRYQSLVCALAYSATGSRCRSEDLAQETFITAWRSLRGLRDPARLRAWLCGIARNVIHGDVRRMERQPAHDADELDAAVSLSEEPLPSAQAVSNEELAILWREIGRLPEIYREPLVLYYREHRSVEHVATALELTPDAVMQRLSRGRRLLQERMLVFVETTLARTNPGPQFALQVTAALPVLAGVGPAIAAGTAAPGGAAAKGGVLGFLLAWIAPFVGVFAAMSVTVIDIVNAPTRRERRFVARWNAALWLSVIAFVITLPLVVRWTYTSGLAQRTDWRATAPLVAVWFGFAWIASTLITVMVRGRAALRRQLQAEGERVPTPRPVALGWRLVGVLAVLTAFFWAPLFVAWRTGDRWAAAAIVAGMLLLMLFGAWLGRSPRSAADQDRIGGWFVVACGLCLIGTVDLRLDGWLAVIYGVDLATMHRLLPPGVLHGLSLFLIAWVTALLALTRPKSR